MNAVSHAPGGAHVEVTVGVPRGLSVLGTGTGRRTDYERANKALLPVVSPWEAEATGGRQGPSRLPI